MMSKKIENKVFVGDTFQLDKGEICFYINCKFVGCTFNGYCNFTNFYGCYFNRCQAEKKTYRKIREYGWENKWSKNLLVNLYYHLIKHIKFL